MLHFHALHGGGSPVVIPENEFVKEHKNLLSVLKSRDPKRLSGEYEEQKAELDRHLSGGAMADDKRLINSKTSYTLKDLPMNVLEFYFNSDKVPKSMKDKLYEAIELKGHHLSGGLKGVSKSSGFIRRLMWENSHKHEGSYKNPTWTLANDSKMKDKANFQWKRLASKSQGGLNEESDYGASPFITKHFKGKVPSAELDTESDSQKDARKEFMAKHFGSVSVPGRPGLPVPPSPQIEETEASKILHKHFGSVEPKKVEEKKVEVKKVEPKKQTDEEIDAEFNFPVLHPKGLKWSSQTIKLNVPKKDWVYNKELIEKNLSIATQLLEWYETKRDRIPDVPFAYPTWQQRTRTKEMEEYPAFIKLLTHADYKLNQIRNPDSFFGDSPFVRMKKLNNYGDTAPIIEKLDVDGIIKWLKEYIKRGNDLIKNKGGGMEGGAKEHTHSTPLGFIKSLPIERKRTTAPPSVVKRAIADVKKLEKIPYKKMSKEEASKYFWGENPIEGFQSVLIDLPIIDIKDLRIRNVRNKTIYHTMASLKKEKYKFVDKGCIVVHKGEIITIYITGADDVAVRESSKHLNELIEQMKEYYPKKSSSFYRQSTLSVDVVERKRREEERKKNPPKAGYYGWNALDGMIRYFTTSQHGNVVSYHQRKPEATYDNDFLYNLIYSYNSIYALERRYAPAVAEYRLMMAKRAEKAEAIPGDPISALPATSLGTSFDFASALHDDSGVKGLTETILWDKTQSVKESYFVNDFARMAFDLSKDNALVLIPPKVSHGTANTGKHGGAGFVIITKQNQVWDTPTNIDWQNAWKKYSASVESKAEFANTEKATEK